MAKFNVIMCATDCFKWSCSIFWTLTGIMFVLAAELTQGSHCKYDSEQRIIIALPIVSAFTMLFSGISVCSGVGVCLKVLCSVIWTIIGIVCTTLSCYFISMHCKDMEGVLIGLVVTGSVTIWIGGCFIGRPAKQGGGSMRI